MILQALLYALINPAPVFRHFLITSTDHPRRRILCLTSAKTLFPFLDYRQVLPFCPPHPDSPKKLGYSSGPLFQAVFVCSGQVQKCPLRASALSRSSFSLAFISDTSDIYPLKFP